MTNSFVVSNSKIRKTLFAVNISIVCAKLLSNKKLNYLIHTKYIIIEYRFFCIRTFASNILIHLMN